MSFLPQWVGPYTTKAEAVEKARSIAIRKQRSVDVFLVIPAEGDRYYALAFTGNALPAGRTVSHVLTCAPDMSAAPKSMWPIVAIAANTDRVAIDIAAYQWRQWSERLAREAGIRSALRPFAASTSDKPIKLYGFRVTLYTLIVRRNPSFPQTPSPIPIFP